MKKCILLFVLLFVHAAAFANSLRLFNDSPFTLSATILAADGTTLGQFTIKPQNGAMWSDQWEQEGAVNNSNISQTPYTVIWYCPSGSEYGICPNQSPGDYVTAGSASGNKACAIENAPMLQPQQ